MRTADPRGRAEPGLRDGHATIRCDAQDPWPFSPRTGKEGAIVFCQAVDPSSRKDGTRRPGVAPPGGAIDGHGTGRSPLKFAMVTTFFGAHSFGGDAAYVDRL